MTSEPLVNAGFEKRWALWQARGVEQHRTSRRRLRIVAMLFVVAACLLSAAMFWL
jgi:hypothetical protein